MVTLLKAGQSQSPVYADVHTVSGKEVIHEHKEGKKQGEASTKEEKSSNQIGQQGKTKERKKAFEGSSPSQDSKPSIKRTQSISENRLSLFPQHSSSISTIGKEAERVAPSRSKGNRNILTW